MGSARPTPRHVLLGAVAGVVVAHAVDYLLVFPSGADRAHHLHAWGHGYWSLAVGVAALAGFGAVVWASVRGVRRAGGGQRRPWTGVLRAVAVVGAWQVAVFTVVEVFERVSSGAPVAGLATRPELVVGLALQLLVAVVVVVVLTLVESAAARAAAAGRRTWALCRDVSGPCPTLAVLVAPGASLRRPIEPPLSRRR